MNVEISRLGRFRGCLLGLAIGDAMGAPLIGMKPGRVAQVYGKIEGFVDPELAWRGQPNRWSLRGLYTGNTQKALAVADILARDGRCEAQALAAVLLEMADAKVERSATGCHRRPSRHFRKTLERLRQPGADPLACGGSSAGSGATARCAPFGLHARNEPDAMTDAVIETSLVTHRDPRAVAAAVAVAQAIALWIATDPNDSSGPAESALRIAERVRAAEQRLQTRFGRQLACPEGSTGAVRHMSESLALLPRLLEEADDKLAYESIVREANRCDPDHEIHDPGDGFAPAAVVTALYLGLGERSFAEAVAAAVGLGRQAHDLGSIVGALAGARHGVEAIPEAWIRELRHADQIQRRADHLERGAIDYASWRGIVDLESEATAAEARERRRLTARWEKQGVLKTGKPKRARQKPRHEPELDFAPPPEVWLRSKERKRRRSRQDPRRRDR